MRPGGALPNTDPQFRAVGSLFLNNDHFCFTKRMIFKDPTPVP